MPQQRGIVIRVRTELEADLPAMAGIESEIREALTNLVFNAVDAMPDGGTLTMRTKTAPSANDSRAPLQYTWKSGTPASAWTKRHGVVAWSLSSPPRATAGRVLAWRWFMEWRSGMNAEIEIESAPGKGTIVRLSFPARVSAATAATLAYATAAPQRLRLLVVDDDPLIIKSLRDTLEADGHAVTAAHGGQEGIDVWLAAEASNEPFAVVITDLGMPHVDGRKVASAVKRARPAAPVILLTGWGQRMAAEQDIPEHVDRVLNKPPKLYELRAAFGELVGSNGAHKAAGKEQAR